MSDRALRETEVLLIDGNNLLHRIAGSADPTAQRMLLARLRGAVPQTIATVVVLDGHAASGTATRQRIGPGMEIRHAGSRSADDAIVAMVDATPYMERHATTVVTDDRSLTERARHLGARTQRLAWLEQILNRSRGGAIGNRRR